MTATITINNVWSFIEGISEEMANDLYEYLSFEKPGAAFVTIDGWDGRRHLFYKINYRFLTGLTYKVYKRLQEQFGVDVKIIRKCKEPKKTLYYEWNNKDYPLREYQKDVIKTCIKKKRAVIESSTGSGKCIHKDSICFTSEGMLPISYFGKLLKEEESRSLVSKILLKNEDGVDESSIIYRDGIKKSIKIITSSGYEITGTPNHRVKILSTKGVIEWKKLKNIIKTDIIVINRKNNLFGDIDILDEDDSYFLGLLCGDGGISRKDMGCITNMDSHILNFCEAYLIDKNAFLRKTKEKSKAYSIFFKKEFRDILFNRYGLKYEKSCVKTIPISILKSSKKIVASFIRGVIETDGWIGKNRSIHLGMSNEKIIRDFQIILLNFGIISNRTVKKTSHKDSWSLNIYGKNVDIYLKEIGLDPDGHKNKRILKIQKKENNTNKDILYNFGEYFSKVKKNLSEKHRNIYYKKGIRYSEKYKDIQSFCLKEIGIKYRSLMSYCYKEKMKKFNRNPSIESAEKILNYYKKNIDQSFPLESFSGKFYYDPIKKIEDGIISDNYDFVIPKTKTFIANGIINHNTIIASKLIQKIGVSPFIFYVLTKDLLYQSKKRLEESISGIEIGIIGDGICDIKDVNIMTVQTACRAFGLLSKNKKEETLLDVEESDLKKIKSENMSHLENKEKKESIKKLINDAKGIYADEIHHYASRTCEKVLLLSPNAFYRFGGSATPIREDNAYMIIEGCFGRKTVQITASDLIEQGYLLQPDISFIPLNINNRQYVDTMAQDRALHIVENEERNNAIVQIANKTREKNLSTLILIQTIEHGKYLLERIEGAEFVYGGTAKKKRKNILERFEKGELKTLIASVIADEGIDLPILSVLILAGGGKSKTRAKQRVGRAIRKGSPYSLIYDFQDIGRWTAKHSRIRRKILREEPKFIVKTASVDQIIKKLNKINISEKIF